MGYVNSYGIKDYSSSILAPEYCSNYRSNTFGHTGRLPAHGCRGEQLTDPSGERSEARTETADSHALVNGRQPGAHMIPSRFNRLVEVNKPCIGFCARLARLEREDKRRNPHQPGTLASANFMRAGINIESGSASTFASANFTSARISAVIRIGL
jgi:hypothetical protein